MDGSRTVLGYWLGSDGLPYSDTLSRIICYGEALRAVTDHVSDQLITGPYEPMIDLLDDAYDRFSKSRVTYSPEEFSIFLMSLLLDLCEDEAEASKLKHGAARYILKSAPILPDEYAGIIEGARRILPNEEAAHRVEGDAPAKTRAAPRDDVNAEQRRKPEREERGGQPRHTARSSRVRRLHLQDVSRETRQLQRSEPSPPVSERQPMARTTRPERYASRPAPRESGVLEKIIAILLLSTFMLYMIFVAFGLLDAPSGAITGTRFE
jgi:hypothetical protein